MERFSNFPLLYAQKTFLPITIVYNISIFKMINFFLHYTFYGFRTSSNHIHIQQTFKPTTMLTADDDDDDDVEETFSTSLIANA